MLESGSGSTSHGLMLVRSGTVKTNVPAHAFPKPSGLSSTLDALHHIGPVRAGRWNTRYMAELMAHNLRETYVGRWDEADGAERANGPKRGQEAEIQGRSKTMLVAAVAYFRPAGGWELKHRLSRPEGGVSDACHWPSTPSRGKWRIHSSKYRS